MLVGEAPGFHEDRRGEPFVGQAGALLERLLARVGLAREDVYLANVLKCRPPGNRDPSSEEVAACEAFLFRQVALVAPRILVALGTVATRLLTGRPDPIGVLRGQARAARIADRTVVLYPVYHPAVALYTPAMLRTLEEDMERIPALVAAARGDAASASGPSSAAVIPFAARPAPRQPPPARTGEQLGLF
jgi:DNA polymerase